VAHVLHDVAERQARSPRAILRCPVCFVAGVFTPPNHYALHFERLADVVTLDRKDRAGSLARYVRTYAAMLEVHVRSAPMSWFNFYDFWSPS
jgi:hypothetical protein